MRAVVGNALEFHSGEIGSIPIARSIYLHLFAINT